MGVVRFKFKGRSESELLKFDGQFITAGELKRLIASKTKLQLNDPVNELSLSNPKKNVVFADEFQRIASNEEVVVSRVSAAAGAIAQPIGGAAAPKMNAVVDFSDEEDEPAAAKPATKVLMEDLDADPFARNPEQQGLQEEEERALMESMYGAAMALPTALQPKPGQRAGPVCRYCGQPGHVIQNCPKKTQDGAKEVRDVRGIPATRLAPTAQGTLFHQQGFVGEVVANKAAFLEDLARFGDEDEGEEAAPRMLTAGEGRAAEAAGPVEEPPKAALEEDAGKAVGARGPGGQEVKVPAPMGLIMTPEGYLQPAPPPRPKGEGKGAPGRPHGQRHQGTNGFAADVVCFCCGQRGHPWTHCPIRGNHMQAVRGAFVDGGRDQPGIYGALGADRRLEGMLPPYLYEFMPQGPRDALTLMFGAPEPLDEEDFKSLQDKLRENERERIRIERERVLAEREAAAERDRERAERRERERRELEERRERRSGRDREPSRASEQVGGISERDRDRDRDRERERDHRRESSKTVMEKDRERSRGRKRSRSRSSSSSRSPSRDEKKKKKEKKKSKRRRDSSSSSSSRSRSRSPVRKHQEIGSGDVKRKRPLKVEFSDDDEAVPAPAPRVVTVERKVEIPQQQQQQQQQGRRNGALAERQRELERERELRQKAAQDVTKVPVGVNRLFQQSFKAAATGGGRRGK